MWCEDDDDVLQRGFGDHPVALRRDANEQNQLLYCYTLLGTSASLLGASALLVGTRS